ncbi:MAG: cytochrome c3 family protein [Gammaproteobacteria bacterium]|nr:cytochrome c3 family protein [Gammaproteobacteria bacterium]
MRIDQIIKPQKKASFLLFGVMLASSHLSSAGVANTKHNLGSTGISGSSNFSGTAEVCVFCHTPHAGNSEAAVPLWNRNLTNSGAFATYDQMGTTTLDGGIEAIGSVSLACLSCHDGSQAMDSVINEPGSGLDVPAYSVGSWSGLAGSTNGTIPVDVVTNLGKDLTNDHPVGVQYAGGGYSNANPQGPGVDGDFNPPVTKISGTTRVWWVNTSTEGGTSEYEKTDMKLYTRVGTRGRGFGEPQPYVECASCHDPHVDENPTFLRITPSGSAVCLACHVK